MNIKERPLSAPQNAAASQAASTQRAGCHSYSSTHPLHWYPSLIAQVFNQKSHVFSSGPNKWQQGAGSSSPAALATHRPSVYSPPLHGRLLATPATADPHAPLPSRSCDSDAFRWRRHSASEADRPLPWALSPCPPTPPASEAALLSVSCGSTRWRFHSVQIRPPISVQIRRPPAPPSSHDPLPSRACGSTRLRWRRHSTSESDHPLPAPLPLLSGSGASTRLRWRHSVSEPSSSPAHRTIDTMKRHPDIQIR